MKQISFRSIFRRIFASNYKIVTKDPLVFGCCATLFWLLIGILAIICMLLVMVIITCVINAAPLVAGWIHWILFIDRKSQCLKYNYFRGFIIERSNVPTSCHLLGLIYEITVPFIIVLGIIITRSVIKMYRTTKRELEDDAIKYAV